jgi:ABC-type glycerol-3-phosphate transport system substrate-binding protein
MFKKRLKLLKLLVLIIVLILPLTGLGCKGTSSEVRDVLRAVEVEVWGVYVNSDELKGLFSIYRKDHPYVTINYRKFRPEEYEKELLNAFAEDRGPDIFMVQNSRLRENLSKLKPLPAEITLPISVIEGTVKPEEKIIMQTMASITTGQVRQSFVDVVSKDVIYPDSETGVESVFALPLSMDTLVLYYNNDLFNRANIAEAPRTWADLQSMVGDLTKFSEEDGLQQSAIALGLSGNIDNAFDILSVLMMQNGSVMVDDRGEVRMHELPANLADQIDYAPALNALEFYSSFAKTYKVNYTWDDYMMNSMEEFAAGNLAMFVGYQFNDELIKNLGPKLHYSIASLPQVNPEYTINYANYWAFGVSKKSEVSNVAWDLIQTMAQAENVIKYLKDTSRVTVLKSLINEQKTDDLGIFVDQILTAQSWYRGMNYELAEEYMKELIDVSISENYESLRKELNTTAQKIDNTYLRK